MSADGSGARIRYVAAACAAILLAVSTLTGVCLANDVKYRAAPGRVVIGPDARDGNARFSQVLANEDGSALVAMTDAGGTSRNVVLFRLRPDGSLDRAYGTFGSVRLDASLLVGLLAAPNDGATAVLKALDTASGSTPRSKVMRLDARGRLDRGFAAGGVLDVAGVETFVAEHGPDGAIVLGGIRVDERAPAALRISVTGAIDQGFGASGWAQIPTPYDLAVDREDRMIVLGKAPGCSDLPVECDLALFRFDAKGAVDRAFGANGFTRLALRAEGADVVADPRGRYWVYGLRRHRSLGRALVRVLADGRIDPAFRSRASRRALGARSGALLLGPHGPFVVTHGPVKGVELVRISDNGAPVRIGRARERFGGGYIGRFESAEPLGARIVVEDAAVRADGGVLVAGRVPLSEPLAKSGPVGRHVDDPAIAALRPGGGLARGFGVTSGPPRVDVGSVRRAGGAIVLRLRAETRGLARVIVRHRGRVIGRRMIGLFRAGTHRVRVTGVTLPASTAVTVDVTANDMAGNVRRLRERRRLRAAWRP